MSLKLFQVSHILCTGYKATLAFFRGLATLAPGLHASDKKCIVSVSNALKSFGGRALPGPAGGAYSAPSDPLAGFGRWEEGKEREGRAGRKGREWEVTDWREGEETRGIGRREEGKKGRKGIGVMGWEENGRREREVTPTVISKSRRLWLKVAAWCMAYKLNI